MTRFSDLLRRKRLWLALTVVVATVLLIAREAGGHSPGDIPAGTGYSALELCTRTMVGGMPFEQVRQQYVEPKVSPLSRIWNVETTRGKSVAVSSRIPLLENARSAIYRPGLGCTVIPPGATEGAVRAQPFQAAATSPLNSAPWPMGEGAVESQLADDALTRVIERHAEIIFDESSADLRMRPNTTALLVARGGHMLHERYGQGTNRGTPQLGWSMTKSLTAMIAGVMAQDGKVALDAPVGLPAWNGSPKQKITWRQLLNMAPGLAWYEGYGGSSDATEMLFSQRDEGAWAADRPLASEPGSVFNYSTGFSNIAMLRLKQLAGGTHQQIYDYYQSRLFSPLGIRSGVIEPDASGTPVGGARGMLRAVDWMRLGQLVLNHGTWNDQQIIPADYVTFMFTASPADAGYGGSLWRLPSEKMSPAIRARLAEDTAWFAGHLSQYVVMVPSHDLVIVRTGVSIDEEGARDTLFALVADLTAMK